MRKEKSTISNKFKGNEVMMQKLAVASEIKAQKQTDKHNLEALRLQMEAEAREKSRAVMQSKQKGLAKQNEFIKKKVFEARSEARQD